MKKSLTFLTWCTLCFFVCSSVKVYAQNLQNFDFGWATKMGSAGMDQNEGIAVDKHGNVYTTGWHNSPADLGDGNLNVANSGMHITKHDAAGNFVWAKSIGGHTSVRGKRIVVDDSSNVYVVGHFVLTVDFDPGPDSFKLTTRGSSGTGTSDIFILKLDKDGDFVWANQAGSGLISGSEAGNDIAIDSLHNVYICGAYFDSAYFGNNIMLRVGGGSLDGFVAKADINGQWVWAERIAGTYASNGAWGIDIDRAENLYVTGGFGGTISLGNLSLTGNGVDIFVAKLTNSGNFLWAKNFGSTGWDWGSAITVDTEGNSYSTGYFAGPTDFGSGTAIDRYGSGSDIYVLKLDSDGNFVWVNRIGGRQSESGGWDVAVDEFKNVYLASRIRDTFITVNTTFDTLNHISTIGGYDIFMAKFDSSGSFIWGTNLGSPGPGSGTDEAAYGIDVDVSGNIYATGIFNGTVDFDPGPDSFMLTNYFNSWDIYILKLTCAVDSASLTVNIQCVDTTINGETYTQSGNYVQVLKSQYGCDSILSIALTIVRQLEEKPVISVSGFVLSTGVYATYQWFLNGQLIEGATNRTLNVSENGDYTVYTTDERGCSDTSEIYTVTNVSVESVSSISKQVQVYPNPSSDVLYIHAPVAVNVVLSGVDGRVLLQKENAGTLSLAHLSEGVYFLSLTDSEGRFIKVEKIIKQ